MYRDTKLNLSWTSFVKDHGWSIVCFEQQQRASAHWHVVKFQNDVDSIDGDDMNQFNWENVSDDDLDQSWTTSDKIS